MLEWPIKFEAIGEYDSYEWKLEDDTTLYNGKATVFSFKYPWGELKMRLIVRSKPDTLCFPDDDGIDTIYKSIFVINKENIDLIGCYHGYLENDPSDTFTVDIRYEGYDKGLVIYNINPGCFIPSSSNYNMIRVGFLNQIAFFDGNGGYGYGCESPLGQAELQKDKKTIIIDYESGPTKERVKYRYIGVKQ